MADSDANGWSEYRRLILAELERLNRRMDAQSDRLTTIMRELENLKGRATVWGALAGAVIGGTVALIVKLLT